MEEVYAIRVHEVRETRRAADAGDAGDLLVRQLQLFHHFEIDGENAEVTAARTPRRVVGDQVLFCVFRAVGEFDFFGLKIFSFGNHGFPWEDQALTSAGSADCFNFSFTPFKISRTLKGRPSVLLMPRILSVQYRARKSAASWP